MTGIKIVKSEHSNKFDFIVEEDINEKAMLHRGDVLSHEDMRQLMKELGGEEPVMFFHRGKMFQFEGRYYIDEKKHTRFNFRLVSKRRTKVTSVYVSPDILSAEFCGYPIPYAMANEYLNSIYPSDAPLPSLGNKFVVFEQTDGPYLVQETYRALI